MKKRFLSISLAIVVFIASIAVFRLDAHALTANVSMWASKYTIDLNETVTISFAIQPAAPCHLEAVLSLPGAVDSVTGNLTYSTVNQKLLSNGVENASYSGQITARFSSPGSKTISIRDIKVARPLENGSIDSNEGNLYTASVTVYVRTEAERQAALAEEQRIREEQERQRQEEASRQAAANESRAIEASIAQSIRESIEEEESIRESIRESVKASESEVEATRPSEIGELTYARQVFENGTEHPTVFYFLIDDESLSVKESYYRAKLKVNSQNVFAERTSSMNKDTYLVYGLFENDDEPHYYFYNKKEGSFFRYSYLFDDEDPLESSEEESDETESEEPEESSSFETESETRSDAENRFFDKDNGIRLLEIGVFAFLCGCAVAALVAVIAAGSRKRKSANAEKQEKPDPIDDYLKGLDSETIKPGKSISFEELEDDFPRK